MKCEKCGINEANTIVKQVVNGEVKQWRLCKNCALESGHGIPLSNLLGSLFTYANASSGAKPDTAALRCSECGKSFVEISQSGKVGCAHCYQTFADQLAPSIQRIHGATKHVGKFPRVAGEKAKTQHEIDTLRSRLNQYIASQQYEKCGEIRDEIMELEKRIEGELSE